MKKVIIIGAGNIGRQAFEYIGEELVECFADNYKAGMNYCGKKVLSIEEIPQYSEDHVFLLAVFKYVEKLSQQLYMLGIKQFYHFEQDVYRGNILQRKGKNTPFKKESLYDISKEMEGKSKCLYGDKRKEGLFLSEVLEISDLYVEIKDGSAQEDYNGMLKGLKNQYDYILINNIYFTQELKNALKQNGMEKIMYVTLYYGSGKYLHEHICRFKDKYKGKRCFIIGNGPSLTVSDLDKLAEKQEICFGLNVIHKIYPNTKWRPDFLCVSDPLVIMQNYIEMINENLCPKFISDIRSLFYPEECEDVYSFHEIRTSKDEKLTPYFASQLEDGIFNGSTVTYIALQICVYMGFEKIYLLGVDCGDWNQHFSKDYWSAKEIVNQANSDRIKRAYEEVEKISRRKKFKVYNATRGGYLEAFDRVDFDMVLKEEE